MRRLVLCTTLGVGVVLSGLSGCGSGSSLTTQEEIPKEVFTQPPPPLSDELQKTKEKLEKEGKIPRQAPR